MNKEQESLQPPEVIWVLFYTGYKQSYMIFRTREEARTEKRNHCRCFPQLKKLAGPHKYSMKQEIAFIFEEEEE